MSDQMALPPVARELAAAADAVARASRTLDGAICDRAVLIRRASEQGMSLRAIAAEVGVNHQRVAQILDREDG